MAFIGTFCMFFCWNNSHPAYRSNSLRYGLSDFALTGRHEKPSFPNFLEKQPFKTEYNGDEEVITTRKHRATTEARTDTIQSLRLGRFPIKRGDQTQSMHRGNHDGRNTKNRKDSKTGHYSSPLEANTVGNNLQGTHRSSEPDAKRVSRSSVDKFSQNTPAKLPFLSNVLISEHNSSASEEESLANKTSSHLKLSGIHGGEVYRVPATWNRLHSVWFRPEKARLLTPEESNYRYLYSAVRVGTSDGIGHSMGVINRDLNYAISLNLTYTHRVGTYSSLTSENRLAVEDFFGWGDGEIPRTKIQEEGCFPENLVWPDRTNLKECHICDRPMNGGALKIKHLVDIPEDLRSNCLHADDPCQPMKSKFLSVHQKSHTIFQASKQSCSPPATDGNFLVSKGIFFHKYWNRHGWRPWDPHSASRSNATHRIRYNQRKLNIAVHVRRGDFLDPETQAKRGITHDEVFAKVIVDALFLVYKEGAVFSEMPIVVHVYSEGKLTKNLVPSIHTIDVQDKQYYDSSGVARDINWWKTLLSRTDPSPELLVATGNRKSTFSLFKDSLDVVLHVSEDTLLCLHEMVSADIFIGSKSGLSNALVWSLSRGIVLIPHASTINVERGKKGEICCSVPFSNDNGLFDSRLFMHYWTTYARANEASALRARKREETFSL